MRRRRLNGHGCIEMRYGAYRVRMSVDGERRTVGTFATREAAESALRAASDRLAKESAKRIAAQGTLDHAFTLPPAPRDVHGIWMQILARCYDTRHDSWRNYGGRGVTVCAEWQSALGSRVFYAHVGPRPSLDHSIDRIDNDRGYEPGNVRWATRAEQTANRRPKEPRTQSPANRSQPPLENLGNERGFAGNSAESAEEVRFELTGRTGRPPVFKT